MSSMTIKELLKEQPKLKNIVDFVVSENERAKKTNVYWHYVWLSVKRKSVNLVGYHSNNEKTRNSQSYDLWHHYLKGLTPNCL